MAIVFPFSSIDVGDFSGPLRRAAGGKTKLITTLSIETTRQPFSAFTVPLVAMLVTAIGRLSRATKSGAGSPTGTLGAAPSGVLIEGEVFGEGSGVIASDEGVEIERGLSIVDDWLDRCLSATGVHAETVVIAAKNKV